MSVDQCSSDPEEPANKSQLQKLVDSVRRGDPTSEFNKLVRHIEYPWSPCTGSTVPPGNGPVN